MNTASVARSGSQKSQTAAARASPRQMDTGLPPAALGRSAYLSAFTRHAREHSASSDLIHQLPHRFTSRLNHEQYCLPDDRTPPDKAHTCTYIMLVLNNLHEHNRTECSEFHLQFGLHTFLPYLSVKHFTRGWVIWSWTWGRSQKITRKRPQ